MEIFNPPNEIKADFIYAILSVDDNGLEGICSIAMAGIMYPCVALKESNIEKMMDLMIEQLKASGITDKKIIRAKFVRRK